MAKAKTKMAQTQETVEEADPFTDAEIKPVPAVEVAEPDAKLLEEQAAAQVAEHKQVVDLMRGRTLEMSFTTHGLPKSRKISGKMADQMAASVKGTKKGVRASWSMFTSDHPQVKALNVAIRELDQLRNDWTIVKSAEVRTGASDAVTVEGGKRLIWDADIPEFYSLFVRASQKIDAEVVKLQHAMNNATEDDQGNTINSIKEMDREHAGDAWDEKVYPEDLTLVVGVSKERHRDGTTVLDADGNPKFTINFNEYHVSEKLPTLLRERAIARVDEGISQTVETAMSHAAAELTENMMTLFDELANRTILYPPEGSKYAHLADAEVVKTLKNGNDSKIPVGHVKVYVRYRPAGESDKKISEWFGPMTEKEYHTAMGPSVTTQKKRLFPSVIEGLVHQLQTFKEKKSKMLGAYGESMVASFDKLLEQLTVAKRNNPLLSADVSARRLADSLRTSDEARKSLTQAIADTVEALEEKTAEVKKVVRRRTIRMGDEGEE